MKAKVTVTDPNGTVFEGEVDLIPKTEQARRKDARAPGSEPAARAYDEPRVPPATAYSLPIRAFMNRYAKGRTGAKAFTIMVARLAGGELGRQVRADEIRREWNKMTGILGGSFATMHGTRAKDRAWVDSPERGVFVLLPDWMDALEGNE
jgi:hypothetical protein